MTTATQLDNAKTIAVLVDGETSETIRAEMYRAYAGLITVARYILSGEVRTISAALGDDLRTAAEEFRTLTRHGTWQAPGEDVPAFVTTDDGGDLTAESELIVGGIHRVGLIAEGDPKRYIGRPATQSRLRLAVNLAELGFKVDFSESAGETMRFQSGEVVGETGYRLTVRHRSA